MAVWQQKKVVAGRRRGRKIRWWLEVVAVFLVEIVGPADGEGHGMERGRAGEEKRREVAEERLWKAERNIYIDR